MVQRVTMSDVAREAGVSLMTVSRVINDKGEISPETRLRVQAVIEKLDYRPSGIARSLAGGQTYTLGLIVPDIANPYFSGVAHGVTSITNEKDFGVLLCDCEEDANVELTMLDVLEEKRVDGVIVAAPRSSTDKLLPVLARHPNAVVINRLFDDTNETFARGYVINDDRKGAYDITTHLIKGGNKLIGFLAGPKTSYSSMLRLGGYRAAHEEQGLEFNSAMVRNCAPTVDGGRQAVNQFLQEHPEVSAIFCFNDLIAIGVLQHCRQFGIKVPDDLAIFGHDDIPVSSWVTPSLSTCRVNFEQMGREAAKLLINYIGGCAGECENLVMEPKLIIRESSH